MPLLPPVTMINFPDKSGREEGLKEVPNISSCRDDPCSIKKLLIYNETL